MPVNLDEAKMQDIRTEVCETLENKIVEMLTEHRLSLKELVYLLGKIHIDVGAALEEHTGPIAWETARKRYTNNPTIGNALMAQGVDMHEWLDIQE